MEHGSLVMMYYMLDASRVRATRRRAHGALGKPPAKCGKVASQRISSESAMCRGGARVRVKLVSRLRSGTSSSTLERQCSIRCVWRTVLESSLRSAICARSPAWPFGGTTGTRACRTATHGCTSSKRRGRKLLLWEIAGVRGIGSTCERAW